jgi:hypothetical protein
VCCNPYHADSSVSNSLDHSLLTHTVCVYVCPRLCVCVSAIVCMCVRVRCGCFCKGGCSSYVCMVFYGMFLFLLYVFCCSCVV